MSITSEQQERGSKPLIWESVPWVNQQRQQPFLDEIQKIKQEFETATPEYQKKNKERYTRKMMHLKDRLHDFENDGTRLKSGALERAKVPGGWLVRHYWTPGYETGGACGITFVPDPEYEWE